MLQLTDKAAVHLRGAFTELDLDEGACFRLGVTEEGAKLVVDQERSGDTIVKHGDELLLVIDAMSANHLEGHTMDYDEATERLVFT
jgi:Fe-S cluster assembly iron-binding protein IscA